MRGLGQYLAGPGSLFNAPSAWLPVGLALLCLTLWLVVVLFLRPLSRDVSTRRILAVIPCVALASILLVLLTQWAAEWIHDEVNEMGALKAARLANTPGSPKQKLGSAIFLSAAYVVGWGHSRSLQPDDFEQHVLSFTLGAGVVEEVVKGVAGLVFIFGLFLDRDLPHLTRRRWVMGFTAAGLSFGAGEAIFYFQAYAGEGADLSLYLLRATWCVLLHGAWSCLTGLLVSCLPWNRTLSDEQTRVFVAGYVACCLPAAVLHGVYDACCIHSAESAWLVGGLCLGLCLCSLLVLRERPASVPGGR